MELLPSSKGEILVVCLLLSLDIPFEREKPLKVGKRTLYCDFFLPERNLVVEYDGKQHFQAVRKFGGKEGVERQKERDREKNLRCEELGWNILRINHKHEVEGLRRLSLLLDPDFSFSEWIDKFNGKTRVKNSWENFCGTIKWEGEVEAKVLREKYCEFCRETGGKEEFSEREQGWFTRKMKDGSLTGRCHPSVRKRGVLFYLGVSFP